MQNDEISAEAAPADPPAPVQFDIDETDEPTRPMPISEMFDDDE